jgi:hypothetical protein
MHDVMLGVRGSSHSEPFADNHKIQSPSLYNSQLQTRYRILNKLLGLLIRRVRIIAISDY